MSSMLFLINSNILQGEPEASEEAAALGEQEALEELLASVELVP